MNPGISTASPRMDRRTYEREFRACIHRYISGGLPVRAEREVLQRSEALTAMFAATVGHDEARRTWERLMAETAARLLSA